MADDFVRVSLAGNRVGVRSRGCQSTREACHCQIEASPEEMNGTGFANESRTKFLQYLVSLQKNAPEPVGILWIVGSVLVVFVGLRRCN